MRIESVHPYIGERGENGSVAHYAEAYTSESVAIDYKRENLL